MVVGECHRTGINLEDDGKERSVIVLDEEPSGFKIDMRKGSRFSAAPLPTSQQKANQTAPPSSSCIIDEEIRFWGWGWGWGGFTDSNHISTRDSVHLKPDRRSNGSRSSSMNITCPENTHTGPPGGGGVGGGAEVELKLQPV